MRIDTYTKTVLTLIALLLAALVGRQYLSPQTVAAQGSFNGVQMAVTPLGYSFFDSRTGEVFEYKENSLRSRYRLTKLGQPLAPAK